MNVLLVHNFYQQAGGEDQVFAEEARLLEQHGHTVARYTVHNDSVEGMGKLELARRTIWNRDAQKSLRRAARDIKADVVHFHNTFPLVSPACYSAAHDAGAAVIQTLHNYRLLCPSATFYRDGRVCEDCLGRAIPWPAVMHGCYRGNRIVSAVAATMLSFHRARGTWRDDVDLYIALTEFARQKFIAGGIPAPKIVVKPNFVDPDPGLGRGDADYILFVGRLTEEKGVRTLIKAWIPLYEKTGAVLRVVGDGPLRAEVEESAMNCAGVQFVGRRPSADVYDMMGAARALVFPSQWYEGQPRTIIESFAKGTPVVASRLGSIPEMIQDGHSGLLFEAGNREDLVKQLNALLSKEMDLARMRQAARREFEQKYTAQHNYPALLQCYELAVANRPLTGENLRYGVVTEP